MSNIRSLAEAAKRACGSLISLASHRKNELLLAVADALEKNSSAIIDANAADLTNAAGKPASFLDRLKFDESRVRAAADGLRKLVSLDDPVGRILEDRTLYNGIRLKKVTVPIGVVAVVYEARPNVTIDAAGLCLKSSNVALLRGSFDAVNTNLAIVKVIRDVLAGFGIDQNAVSLTDCGHDGVTELLSLDKYIDLAIPRGSKSLIDFVRKNALVPVIETGAGNCSAYLDGTLDVRLAKEIILNGKTSRVSVCNALESLYIKDTALEYALSVLDALNAAGVVIHGDKAVCAAREYVVPAQEDDYYKEYLSLDISARIVSGVEDAVECVNKYGTHHSDVILSANAEDIEYFLNNADSAAVYANASTRFTDGFEFGMGAEIGISTQKLHARGPMGLNELVTYKYLAYGDGQTRN